MKKFNNVIVRRPCKAVCDGITSAPELGQPIYEKALEQHDAYIEALKKCGVTDAQAYYALVKEAEEQGIIRKTIHPDTKESWVELSDDSVLPF